jgi:hypothetical protein
MVTVELTDSERAALITLLAGLIEGDPMPESERVLELRQILAKLRAARARREASGSWAPAGAVTLAEIADRGGTLEIECADCKRFGRYQIPRLIERYGQKMGQPHLREILAADCPRMRSVSI